MRYVLFETEEEAKWRAEELFLHCGTRPMIMRLGDLSPKRHGTRAKQALLSVPLFLVVPLSTSSEELNKWLSSFVELNSDTLMRSSDYACPRMLMATAVRRPVTPDDERG